MNQGRWQFDFARWCIDNHSEIIEEYIEEKYGPFSPESGKQ